MTIPPPEQTVTAVSLVYPVLLVVATWWVGTGVVLYLQQRLNAPGRGTILSLLSVAVMSLLALITTSHGHTVWHSYAGFMAAVVLWGCLELSYFTGLIAGVHKQACPARCSLFKRFQLALGASIWHELSVLLAALLVLVIGWKAQNPAGLYTFVVLWLMRWSAKLNLFLGVPNFNTDWFPKHMSYAHSYIKRSRVSLLFPVSVLVASAAAVSLMVRTLTAVEPQVALSTALPCVLLMLAILEHLFLALPIADSALWNRVFAQNSDASNTLVP